MKWSRILNLYGIHCEGEVGRCIIGGAGNFPGKTVLDKMRYINEENDWIRRFTLQEPRGSAMQSVNLILPPVEDGSDASFIVLQPDEAHALSGSNTMCISTCLLETGMVPMKEPETQLRLDTAVGLIKSYAKCKDGKVESVRVEMCPSFAAVLDREIDVPGIGKIKVDVGFGGCFFCLVDVNQVGLKIDPSMARELVDKAVIIKKAADEQIQVRHPDEPAFNHIEYVMWTDKGEGNVYINGTVIHPGRMDRSPCGTGTSTRLAIMYAKGQLKEGEEIYTQSIIGGRFKDSIVGTTKLSDGTVAVIPSIEGRCWFYNIEQLGIEPTDPFPVGYTMSDTWGPLAGT